MNQFRVNGISQNLPLGAEAPFQEMIRYIREHFNSDTALVSSIRVDGLEITVREETDFAQIPVSSIDSIDVATTHPREIAEDTLQELLRFIPQLVSMSRDTAARIADPSVDATRAFGQLVEGMGIFTESITTVKQILRVGLLQAVNLLEADLLSIMKDLLASRETPPGADRDLYLTQLLSEHLPANLEEWRKEGLPALIRSRDS